MSLLWKKAGRKRMYFNTFKKMNQNGGFTLIEVIVTLIVAAILGTVLFTFMGSTMRGSVQPLLGVQNANTAGQVMENIITDYNKLNFDDIGSSTTVALSTLKTDVQNGNVSTNTPYFGAYTIVYNDYVTLNSNGATAPIADTTGNNWTLRVSIKQGSQTLTTLFTK
jgi:prepilin-type N-terminal cleavage/methylation domain-containing protein